MLYDILVIGGGPAGLTAAVYARRAGKTVLVLEKGAFGGQITFSPAVENIPGFERVSGNEFADRLTDQALAQGAELESAEVTGLVREDDGTFSAFSESDPETGRSKTFRGRAVILASGAKHRTLGLPGEEDFIGNGISFCAVCDGAFYRDRPVAVVGGGNSALQEALLLSDLCEWVTVVQNLPVLTGEKPLADALMERENVDVIFSSLLTAYEGDPETGLTGILVKHENGLTERVRADAVFLAVGLEPQNGPFAPLVPLDGRGYADADDSCATPTPGLFVAGDCRKKKIRQVTTAASDGAVAALAACDFLDGRG
jgi:thioredoxin reductase (NADPH)